MSDYLLHCAASNWLMSSVLAAFAWFAQSKLRRPVIAHLLWLLVLVKLVTPPLFSLAVIPAPVAPAATLATNVLANHTGAASTALASEPVAAATLDATSVLLSLWLLGSVIVLIWSTFRIVRFHRLLTLASRPAPQDLMQRAAQLAKTLGLKKTPSINITSARVTPMVWWVGGKVRVFIPEAMPAELGSNQMRWILAHELGHVRRGDHFVRWLEWLACVAFWWNPIAWLARRNLRANEEVCCDALVLRSLKGKPHSYANSLLAAVEFLASPGLRPPAMASEINSGGFLERRFRMIVSKTPIATTPRWLQAVLLVCTVAVMPLGIAYAQNPDVGAVTKRLRKAVQAGEVSPIEARKMLRALKTSEAQDPRKSESKRSKELEHYKRLVNSLKEGLREGIQSGELDENEALKIYERQMAILKEGVAKKTGSARGTTRGKKAKKTGLKQKLEWAVKAGDLTKDEAMVRAKKLAMAQAEQQNAIAIELEATAQHLRLVETKLRKQLERIDPVTPRRKVIKRRTQIRKEFEQARRQVEEARKVLDKASEARGSAMRKQEWTERAKGRSQAKLTTSQLKTIDQARMKVAKEALLIAQMQAKLVAEQASLRLLLAPGSRQSEFKVTYIEPDVFSQLGVDQSKQLEEVDHFKAKKAKSTSKNMSKERSNLDIRYLGVERSRMVEANRAILREKERSSQLHQEVESLRNMQQQEQLKQRAIQLKPDLTVRRATSKKKDLKTRAAELKREMELRSAALKIAGEDAVKALSESRRRSGIR
ncbi:MAG: beta-lactamase regulating signal transducer with metallopeptidase domain [Neolewinella sp.]|jgi:beta-lactamase regulating signal transducer with metallopeptidase domain